MAEVIGLISGLMTVGGAGLALFDTLSRFAETIKSAERHVALVAGDIRSTVAVLQLIRRSLQKAEGSKSPIIQTGLDILPDLTKQCTTCFGIIQGLIEYLEPYHDPTIVQTRRRELIRYSQTSKRPQFLEKWKWRQKRPEVDRLRNYLESLKSSLQLLLSVLDLELAEERHASTNTREILREELERALTRSDRQSTSLDKEFAGQNVSARRTDSSALIRRQDDDMRPQAMLRSLALTIVSGDMDARTAYPVRSERPKVHLETSPFHRQPISTTRRGSKIAPHQKQASQSKVLEDARSGLQSLRVSSEDSDPSSIGPSKGQSRRPQQEHLNYSSEDEQTSSTSPQAFWPGTQQPRDPRQPEVTPHGLLKSIPNPPRAVIGSEDEEEIRRALGKRGAIRNVSRRAPSPSRSRHHAKSSFANISDEDSEDEFAPMIAVAHEAVLERERRRQLRHPPCSRSPSPTTPRANFSLKDVEISYSSHKPPSYYTVNDSFLIPPLPKYGRDEYDYFVRPDLVESPPIPNWPEYVCYRRKGKRTEADIVMRSSITRPSVDFR